MQLSPPKSVSVALMLLVFGLSWVNPIWPKEQALHSSLTVLGFAFLWHYARRHPLSARDVFLFALFMSAHSVAARWLYSNVPYDKWSAALLGVSINQQFGWTRNHFDRLVHLMYGFCLTPMIASHVLNQFRLSRKIAFYIAATAIMVTSLWYEWFEWLLAVTLTAQDAESYNGQQGDIWDAHKDMLMATIGSLLWARSYLKAARASA